MDGIIQNVDQILKKNGKLNSDFGELSKIYLMTTENIRAFLEKYNLQDKEILTVAGSGDQMLNAYLMGAKNVTCFDINPLAFYQVKLKKAAVSTLSYEEFTDFFFYGTEFFFNPDLFKKIAGSLDKESIDFWNYFFSNYSSDQIYYKLFHPFGSRLKQQQRLNSYLEQDNYQKLAAILKDKEVSFIQSNVTTLREQIDNNYYDMILLSNISDSIENIWPDNSLKNFKRLIHSLSKNLKNNGIIQVGYIYTYYYNYGHVFKRHNEREKIFTPDEFKTTLIPSYQFHSESDAVVTFQKKKKKN